MGIAHPTLLKIFQLSFMISISQIKYAEVLLVGKMPALQEILGYFLNWQSLIDL